MEIVSMQNIIILILVVIIIFSYLGINILVIVANFAQQILNIFAVIVVKLLATLGFTAGNVLNKTSEVVTNVGKTSLDVINGTIHDIDNVVINASAGQVPNLNTAINSQSVRSNHLAQSPIPSSSMMPIQNPISSAKTSYCLVGEFQSKRGCIEVGENDLCMSGQLFSSRELCMNPTLTANVEKTQQIAPFNSIAMLPLPPIQPAIPNELMPQGIYNS